MFKAFNFIKIIYKMFLSFRLQSFVVVVVLFAFNLKALRNGIEAKK